MNTMNARFSTFDKLVDTLSTEEAQNMLSHISDRMKLSMEMQPNEKKEQSLLDIDEEPGSLRIENESFFMKLRLRLRAFFKSLSIDTVYESELLRRIGKYLHRNYRQYINIKTNLFTNDFYELLRTLRKTQSFFISLLAAYDGDKGDFYLLISSFAIPELYSKLMHTTDPFSAAPNADPSAATPLRSEFLKELEETFELITSAEKTGMYKCAQAIEWIRHFCNLPLDKAISRFTVNSIVDATCPIQLISTEMAALASVVNAAKPIPDTVLQSLFLLSKQDRFDDKSLNLGKESTEFISQASHALEAIKYFTVNIPMKAIARYAGNSVRWEPKPIERGEDWFLVFKNAWKKRFNEQWHQWITEKKRNTLYEQMLQLLNVTALPNMPYRPWEDAWLVLRLKRELAFTFLSTFFSNLYTETVQPLLKILLMEGNFYRRENLTEYTNVFTLLDKQQNNIDAFMSKISPEGDIGNAFMQLKITSGADIKAKSSFENLMKKIETEAKQILTASQSAIRTLTLLLNGFIEGNKSDIYAPLINWGNIQGSNNAEFRRQVGDVKKMLQKTDMILTDAENLVSDD